MQKVEVKHNHCYYEVHPVGTSVILPNKCSSMITRVFITKSGEILYNVLEYPSVLTPYEIESMVVHQIDFNNDL